MATSATSIWVSLLCTESVEDTLLGCSWPWRRGENWSGWIIQRETFEVHFTWFLKESLVGVSPCPQWWYQFSSVAQSCPTLYDPINYSTQGLPAHHQCPEFTQTHVHRVRDAIQPSHPLLSPSPAPNPSQHQNLSQWVSSLHEVAKVLEFQL